MNRYEIIQTIKSVLDGLPVYVRGEFRMIHTSDTILDPTLEAKENLPLLTIVPGPTTALVGLTGFAPLDTTMRLDLYGFIDGADPHDTPDKRSTALSKAVEHFAQVIRKKLTDPAFIDEIQCAFSITQIGPYIVEHALYEEPLAYLSMPLTIVWTDDVQNDDYAWEY